MYYTERKLKNKYGGGLGTRLCTARWRFRLCTGLASRPMAVVFGLGIRLRVRMRTKLEIGILSNRQQPQSVVNGFC